MGAQVKKMHFNLQNIINVTTVSQKPVNKNHQQNQILDLSLEHL